jgi:post-segregation antitoxin (ccd killing protein)
MTGTVIISSRFCGPADSGNGGYSCGVVASILDGVAEVTLRRPPPLDRPIALVRTGEGVQAMADGELVAEARPAELNLEAPPAPSLQEAIEASKRFLWRENHLYPRCFVCGPKRAPGDGLCIYPGAVEGREVAAAPFTPDATLCDAEGRLRPEMAWAALDCPSWFGFHCFNHFDGVVLLGRLAARIDALPRIGDRCISVGWSLGREGRKIHCAAALYAEGGPLLAMSRATWIVTK